MLAAGWNSFPFRKAGSFGVCGFEEVWAKSSTWMVSICDGVDCVSEPGFGRAGGEVMAARPDTRSRKKETGGKIRQARRKCRLFASQTIRIRMKAVVRIRACELGSRKVEGPSRLSVNNSGK